MTAGSQRAALDAIDAARPIVARLGMGRNTEDLAADLIEAWTAVETGLRSLVGGSALTGQTLIRELRQRHFLNLEQANSLAEFHAARERASRTDYSPTEGDVSAARDAFLKLEAGLMGGATGASPAPAIPAADATGAPRADAPRTSGPVYPPATQVPPAAIGRPTWLVPLLALVGLLLVGGIAWFALAGRSGSSGAYAEGVTAYREGRREAAEGSFRKAASDMPNDPMPHVYLARMEREKGNLSNAQQAAVKAVQLGPENGLALRELASTLFAIQNFDGARTFYIRAIKADSTDRLAQGFLGCSLVRLGRIDEGTRFMQRAGSGAWSSCVPQPGVVPGGMGPAPVPMMRQ